MSLWNFLSGGGVQAVANGVSKVGGTFLGDQAAQDAQASDKYQAAIGQFANEFSRQNRSTFDIVLDALNRLPRPLMAFATLALFAFAMFDPIAFTAKMQGLAHVPDPLWWILGAIVAFYFGAREASKAREFRATSGAAVQSTMDRIRAIESIDSATDPTESVENSAISDWRGNTS